MSSNNRDRPTRVQIARARARVALAKLSGTSVLDQVRDVAGFDFADAEDAVSPKSDADEDPGPQAHRYADFAGVHARGFDFGPHHDPVRLTANDPRPSSEQERVLIAAYGSEVYEETLREIARGELDEIILRSQSDALSAALTVDEAAEWIGTGTGRALADIHLGDLFAFVCDGELRLPAWQFTAAPDAPTLRHLSRLIRHFEADLHPATILGFMTTPHDDTLINGVPVTPIVWLLADGDPQELIDMLDAFYMS